MFTNWNTTCLQHSKMSKRWVAYTYNELIKISIIHLWRSCSERCSGITLLSHEDLQRKMIGYRRKQLKTVILFVMHGATFIHSVPFFGKIRVLEARTTSRRAKKHGHLPVCCCEWVASVTTEWGSYRGAATGKPAGGRGGEEPTECGWTRSRCSGTASDPRSYPQWDMSLWSRR